MEYKIDILKPVIAWRPHTVSVEADSFADAYEMIKGYENRKYKNKPPGYKKISNKKLVGIRNMTKEEVIAINSVEQLLSRSDMRLISRESDLEFVIMDDTTLKPIERKVPTKHHPKQKGILWLDKHKNELGDFRSIREASRSTGVGRKTITKCMASFKPVNGKGYYFREVFYK